MERLASIDLPGAIAAYYHARMKTWRFGTWIFLAAMAAMGARARAQQASDFKSEYLKEFDQTSKNLVQLAEAMPAEKYAWRPGTGVRSVSEVYVHIANGNYLLLGMAGAKTLSKPEAKPGNKDEVVQLLKASLEAVREQFSNLAPVELDKPADFFGQKTTVRGIYLRILAHVNEHYGQSIAYARVNGIVPPWSK